MRNSLKQYLVDPASVLHFMLGTMTVEELMKLLKPPLSRGTFEATVRADKRSFDDHDQLKPSTNDKEVLPLMDNFLFYTQEHYQNYIKLRADGQQADLEVQKPSQRDWHKSKFNNLYRVVNVKTLESLAQDGPVKSAAERKQQNTDRVANIHDYQQTHYLPVQRVTSDTKEGSNYGLNRFDEHRAKNYAEIDYVMHALGIVPDIDSVPLVQYKPKFFTKLSDQSMPSYWRLQMEKMTLAAQPSELPQFH